MKVIGETRDGFIIESTRNEIFNLIGFYWSGETGCPKVEVGMQINVSAMYRQLYELQSNKDQLSKLADRLRVVASLLESDNPLIPVPSIDE